MSKKIGLLLRSYAKTAEDVPGVVERALKSINRVSNLWRLRDDSPAFNQIIIVTPIDYDCSETAEAIRTILCTRAWQYIENVTVLEAPGHHSCGALNSGVDILATLGVGYTVIVSNKAIAALTADTTEAIIEAFDVGAKAVGVAVDELQDVVLDGRIQNTCAGWEINALRAVGGFDSEKGVEEIASTVRLIREYGACIAVLDPKKKPVLDIRKTADGKARHDEVMNTKIARQLAEVERVGSDFNFIKSGIMPGYPLTV
ncbi:MAG: hypothetical protein HZB12_03605 [Candidatus Yonathbacteria bacterium]|nr:hypothetical protein [Candidatus Yonathbacteria bacterium]